MEEKELDTICFGIVKASGGDVNVDLYILGDDRYRLVVEHSATGVVDRIEIEGIKEAQGLFDETVAIWERR